MITKDVYLCISIMNASSGRFKQKVNYMRYRHPVYCRAKFIEL